MVIFHQSETLVSINSSPHFVSSPARPFTFCFPVHLCKQSSVSFICADNAMIQFCDKGPRSCILRLEEQTKGPLCCGNLNDSDCNQIMDKFLFKNENNFVLLLLSDPGPRDSDFRLRNEVQRFVLMH